MQRSNNRLRARPARSRAGGTPALAGMSGRMALSCLALSAALVLAGCAEYLDRRETISLNGGDALAANKVTHMVDPWPLVSADRNIAFNGSKMQGAVERYRTNRVIQPKNTGTSTSYSAAAAPEAAVEVKPTVNAPPAK